MGMLETLKYETPRIEHRLLIAGENAVGGQELQRRAFVLFGSSFAVTFTMFALRLLEVKVSAEGKGWFQWVSSGANFSAFALLYLAARNATSPRVLGATLGALGGIACLVSYTFVGKHDLLPSVLFLFLKPQQYACNVLIITCALSVTAASVRCSTICWLFGFSRLGAACAALLFALPGMGHGNALFAIAAAALFVMMLPQLVLSPKREVLILTSIVPVAENKGGVEYMKNTLDAPRRKKERHRKTRTSATSSRGHGSEIKLAGRD
ncbi:hypothetical protein V5799_030004 [Amblyomma americanum]|uniref:Uncharacterized protein n=1 Tax=Amblyomma americanum TaxID=6943 RepID=A0AAQ4EPN5_AMBAM